MAIGLETEIRVSIGSALAATGALLVGIAGIAWVASSFIFGEVKDDVSLIREDLSALRASSESKVVSLETSGTGVERALTDLVAQLEITNARLQDLSDNLVSVDQRLSGSIQRQQEFEQFIVTRLPAPTSVPEGWLQSQKDIVTEISSGTDPLLLWYKALPRDR